MFLLNLTLGQFLALLGVTSGMVVALYLLDRARHRQIVATLRFWSSAQDQPAVRHRRRIQQPLSLALQLLGIALLLLAVAQLRLGSPGRPPRDHVVILDTSAWMGARAGRSDKPVPFMDKARALARSYIRALPAADRVMLVRADALATPVTGFESNRKVLDEAVARSQPGATGLNLDQALEFATQVQKLHARRAGEIVLIGAGRIAAHDNHTSALPAVANLRVLPVASDVENCGIRKIGLRRSPSDNGLWEVFIAVRNYGSNPRTLDLVLRFDGSLLGTRRLSIAPGTERNTSFELETRAAGRLEAQLLGEDAFAADDRAVLDLPAQRALKVAVYSDEPELLRPLFAANPRVVSVFRSSSRFDPKIKADIVVFDRFVPKPLPPVNAILIEPPPGASPAAVRSTLSDVKLVRWRVEHELAFGLRTKDLRLESTEVFQASPGDIELASADAGPVILARAGNPKLVLLGFHPVRSAMRYELATPLLFANILRWMSPEVFQRWELNTGTVGALNVVLDPGTDVSTVRVAGDNGDPVPFTIEGRVLRLFAASPGTIRISTPAGEMVYSLTLPEVGEAQWVLPRGTRHGIPSFAGVETTSSDLWHLLALAGALSLFAEWWLFGRRKKVPFSRASRAGTVIPISRLRGWVAASLRRAP
jgi:hypothetical protein